LIGWFTSRDQRGVPVELSSPKIEPPLDPITSVPPATTGVPVKSPSEVSKRQACPRVVT
jgi:hypothetical protein